MKHENHIQTGMRVPESYLDRADKLAARMSQPGIRVTRTEVLRAAVARGLEALEKEHKR